jgi:hypothetical protein
LILPCCLSGGVLTESHQGKAAICAGHDEINVGQIFEFHIRFCGVAKVFQDTTPDFRRDGNSINACEGQLWHI